MVAGLLLSLVSSAQAHKAILTYMGDPSTTLTVNWQTELPPQGQVFVSYWSESSDGELLEAEAKVWQVDGLPDRTLYRAQLTGLEPDTVYYLNLEGSKVANPDAEGCLKVRTIPADDRPLRFATGGDMGVSNDTRMLLRHAASHSPDFAAVGGDIAYANGALNNAHLWDKWLSIYTEEMVTPDGFTIPLMLAIGNHEVKGAYNRNPSAAPFFFNYFGQDTEKSYFARQFGANLGFLVLDSGHTTTHASQVPWLEEQLQAYSDLKYRAAIYHVPLYPTRRDFMDQYARQGRKHWGPVFDAHDLTVAFENHDHTFKRSHLLRDGERATDGDGTLYLGDGCWGIKANQIQPGGRWYHDVCGSVQHFWLVDVSNEGLLYRAYDLDNVVFDVYPQSHPDAAAARAVFAKKEHKYSIPDGAIRFDELQMPTADSAVGKMRLRMENPFSDPVTCSIKLKGGVIRYTGLPDGPVVLSAGEVKEIDIQLRLKSKKPVNPQSLKSVWIMEYKVEAADGQPEQRYNRNYDLANYIAD